MVIEIYRLIRPELEDQIYVPGPPEKKLFPIRCYKQGSGIGGVGVAYPPGRKNFENTPPLPSAARSAAAIFWPNFGN